MFLPSVPSFSGETVPNVPVQAAAVARGAGAWLGESACRAGRMLGLCAKDAPALGSGLLARGRYRLRAARPMLAHPVFELVKMFADDMPVAEMGNMRIRLKIRIE
jgi:hypothetical protein